MERRDVFRSMENRRNVEERTRQPKEVRKSDETNVRVDEIRAAQIEEINKLIRLKVQQEQGQEEGRRKRHDDTPWSELLSKILPLPNTKKYTKISYIGEGSYSTVHKVKDDTGKIFALKNSKLKMVLKSLLPLYGKSKLSCLVTILTSSFLLKFAWVTAG